jgi:hypothetical protein
MRIEIPDLPAAIFRKGAASSFSAKQISMDIPFVILAKNSRWQFGGAVAEFFYASVFLLFSHIPQLLDLDLLFSIRESEQPKHKLRYLCE